MTTHINSSIKFASFLLATSNFYILNKWSCNTSLFPLQHKLLVLGLTWNTPAKSSFNNSYVFSLPTAVTAHWICITVQDIYYKKSLLKSSQNPKFCQSAAILLYILALKRETDLSTAPVLVTHRGRPWVISQMKFISYLRAILDTSRL